MTKTGEEGEEGDELEGVEPIRLSGLYTTQYVHVG